MALIATFRLKSQNTSIMPTTTSARSLWHATAVAIAVALLALMGASAMLGTITGLQKDAAEAQLRIAFLQGELVRINVTRSARNSVLERQVAALRSSAEKERARHREEMAAKSALSASELAHTASHNALQAEVKEARSEKQELEAKHRECEASLQAKRDACGKELALAQGSLRDRERASREAPRQEEAHQANEKACAEACAQELASVRGGLSAKEEELSQLKRTLATLKSGAHTRAQAQDNGQSSIISPSSAAACAPWLGAGVMSSSSGSNGLLSTRRVVMVGLTSWAAWHGLPSSERTPAHTSGEDYWSATIDWSLRALGFEVEYMSHANYKRMLGTDRSRCVCVCVSSAAAACMSATDYHFATHSGFSTLTAAVSVLFVCCLHFSLFCRSSRFLVVSLQPISYSDALLHAHVWARINSLLDTLGYHGRLTSGEIHRVFVRNAEEAYRGEQATLGRDPAALCRITALHFWGNFDVETEPWSRA
jgi:hypothetical protein